MSGRREPRPGSSRDGWLRHGWPLHGWLGVALVAVCWTLNWTLSGLRTHLLFFPLWLGYILTVDALVFARDGSSLLSRSRRRFVLLFFASMPAWWMFELLNLRIGNWVYEGRGLFDSWLELVLSSLCFSTVMPAVFETAELVHGASWIERFRSCRRLEVTPRLTWVLFSTGALMLALLLAWPRYFYPLTWLSLLFLLDPICWRSGRRSLLAHLERGDRRALLALATGAVICGFFWEMWNFYSYPRWRYEIPFLGVWHVFEMPLLGYLGYLPFGLELYSLVHLLMVPPPDLRVGIFSE